MSSSWFLWVKAFHLIAVITWFAALFYLPRLFIYHREASDAISIARFKVMEGKLLRIIMTPSAVIATTLGLVMLIYAWPAYASQGWMHAKLTFVALLWVYHLLCWHYVRQFAADAVTRPSRFFRLFNEIPVLPLFVIVICVIVRPF